MDKVSNNVLAAVMLELEMMKILEQDESTASWADVDKSKLPAACFLWVEDPKKKSTWHLPYREGTGGIDPETGMYRQAGPVNLNALRAVSQAMGGARTGQPMNLPAEIKAKIVRLLKKYKIGNPKRESMKLNNFTESIFSAQVKHDKDQCIVYGMAVLKNTSQNCSYKNGKGRQYTEQALQSMAGLVNGTKAYINHATMTELEARGGIRDIRDLLGYYENGRVEGNITRADLHYLESHKKWFAPIVEQMADKIGGSIHAYGPSSFNNDTLIETVQDIKVLRSVDIVTEPGSTNNLFESLRRGNNNEMDITTLTIKDLNESRPDLVKAIVENYKDSENVVKSIKEREEKIKALEEENKKIKGDLDNYQVKEALAKKEQLINEKLEKSKLPKEAITETFRKTLVEAKDESAIDALIKDRQTLVKANPVVTGMGDGTDPGSNFNYTESAKEYGKAIEGYKPK